MKRRDFFKRVSIAGMGVAAASTSLPAIAQVSSAPTADVAGIYELQAAFHRAKTAQDIELMMSLWDPNGKLAVQGNPNSPFTGTAQLRGYWTNSGSFKNRRFSLVPSFKTRIEVTGDHAKLYFECHDVGDYDTAQRSIVNDTYLTGTVTKIGDKWVFSDMVAGPSTPLSFDHYYGS